MREPGRTIRLPYLDTEGKSKVSSNAPNRKATASSSSTPTTTPNTRAAAAASDSAEIMSEKSSIVMSEGLRAFLQQAGVGQYENSFLEKLELTELVHLDQLLPRFDAQRKKFLESVTTEERLRLAHGTPTIKLQQILTSRDPTTWRLFAWMLSRIFAIRRRGWETYQREKLLTTQDRQKKRNRAPRRAAAVKKMNDNK